MTGTGTDGPTPQPFDPDIDAAGLEELRLAIRAAGPTSGIEKRARIEADALLTRVRDFVMKAAANRAARLQVQQQQRRQRDLI